MTNLDTQIGEGLFSIPLIVTYITNSPIPNNFITENVYLEALSAHLNNLNNEIKDLCNKIDASLKRMDNRVSVYNTTI